MNGLWLMTTLSSFNTGVSSFGPKNPRNLSTFKEAREYITMGHDWDVVELAVEYAVPDIAEITKSVSLRKGNLTLKSIWECK